MATATLLETTSQEPLSETGPVEARRIEEPLYEVVNGRRLELPPMAVSSNRVANVLTLHMGNHVDAKGLGRVSMETLHWLEESGELKRRPDVSFVSYTRWPRTKPITDEEAWDVVPELVVEVVSPTDRAEDLLEKVEEYFHAGVLQVWVVYPGRRVVYIYETFTRITVVSPGQDLDGGAVLPGFTLPLATIFADLGPKDKERVKEALP